MQPGEDRRLEDTEAIAESQRVRLNSAALQTMQDLFTEGADSWLSAKGTLQNELTAHFLPPLYWISTRKHSHMRSCPFT